MFPDKSDSRILYVLWFCILYLMCPFIPQPIRKGLQRRGWPLLPPGRNDDVVHNGGQQHQALIVAHVDMSEQFCVKPRIRPCGERQSLSESIRYLRLPSAPISSMELRQCLSECVFYKRIIAVMASDVYRENKNPRLVSRSNPGCIDMIRDNLNTINILRRCPDHSFTEDAENWTWDDFLKFRESITWLDTAIR